MAKGAVELDAAGLCRPPSGSAARGIKMSLKHFIGLGVITAAVLARPCVAQATEDESVSLEDDSASTANDKHKDKEPAAANDERNIKQVVAPYSMPWHLRPVLPSSYARLDNSFAFYGVNGNTIVDDFTFSYRIIPRLSVLARLAVTSNSPPPSEGDGAFGFANPVIGAQTGFWPAKGLKLGLFLGFALPLGMGGGLDANQAAQHATWAAMHARSGFDDPLYMPDYFTVWPGIDVAYVTHGLTVQAELSLPIMSRARGPQSEKTTNFDLAMGLHGGYFIFPFLSAGLDLRYQRWLTDAPIVLADPTRQAKDTTTIEPGVRFHVKVSDSVTFRPGVALAFGLDNPLAGSSYKILRLDLPLTF
jgi:hypothetical protein